ncbi:hypothetical protein MSAN_01763000 [Mycena sanguinolenta]|uniref:Uncharacterized protein n=1 Tax=Mycena sanguinolenta TaxID=230812 RepID=A0A8H6XWN9_9AGAR|nr:hypothetical protein MSAN_01763000 [Mycena sanguinolenta]
MMLSSTAPHRIFVLLLLTVHFLSVHAHLETRDEFSDSGLSSASWIWLPEPDLHTTAPTGSVAFLQTLTSPAGKTAVYASIAITADNNFTLWVNYQPIGASDPVTDWKTAQIFTAALNASVNVFSVLGSNTGTVTPNPAGLLAAIRVFFLDDTNETIFSDDTWVASGTIPSDFPLPHDLSSFVRAEVAATYGSGPWGTDATIPAPDPNPLNLTGSAWIWSTANANNSAAVGSVGFRKTVTSPIGKTATSATVLVTADNTFQLWVNGQYIGAPPFDNNTAGTIGSWEFAQLFTVALTPSTNVFTVFATNFPATSTASSPSSAGMVGALQITFSDGTTEVIGTDATWLAGTYTSASTFLDAADSALVAAVSSGLFGIGPWGTLRGTSNALNVLQLPTNNAAVVASSPTTSGPASSAPPMGAARALMDSQGLFAMLGCMVSVLGLFLF